MKDWNLVSSPLAVHFRLSLGLSPEIEDKKKHMYAMTCTHPDISNVVSVVNIFMVNPSKVHWHDIKWLFHYLRGTINIDLVYNRGSSTRKNVEGFVNLDYVSDLDMRRSL